MPDTVYDVVIIGGGPAGTTAAIYTARARLRTAVIDKARLGGALAITRHIANYPGMGYDEPLTGSELLRRMHEHAAHFAAEFVQSPVFAVDLAGEPKQVFTADDVYAARTVIIASGAGLRRQRLPGEAELLGRGVSYCATCDGAFFARQEVAVVGNSEEAFEEALYLARHASRVHLFSPASQLFAEGVLAAQVEASAAITVNLRHRVRAIQGEQAVEAIVVQALDGDERTVPVAGVFVYLSGNQPAVEFVEGQVNLDERGYVAVGLDRATSVPGVFAAGDICGHPVRQVTLAVADGTLAALAAEQYLRQAAGDDTVVALW